MKSIIFTFGVLLYIVANSPVAYAFDLTGQSCQVIGGNCNELTGDDGLSGDAPVVANAVGIALGLLGAIAVIMLIIGGLRFITSQGDPQQIKQAKSTVLYAVIGITVAIIGYGILQYVVQEITQ